MAWAWTLEKDGTRLLPTLRIRTLTLAIRRLLLKRKQRLFWPLKGHEHDKKP